MSCELEIGLLRIDVRCDIEQLLEKRVIWPHKTPVSVGYKKLTTLPAPPECP
jgi:hypothetical protein